MRKLVLFMHVSLDGFVNGPDGEMDWIKVDEEIFDYAGQRTDASDTALYGRVTYELMESYWPTATDKPNASKHDIKHARWYKEVEKVVVSKTMKGKNIPGVGIISENVREQITKLKQLEGKEIIMFGSPSLAHSLMKEDLIDEYWLFVNPILVGNGKPVFKNISQKTKLKLEKTQVFSSGVVCLHYSR